MFSFATDSGLLHATHNPRLVISEVHPNALADGSSTESHEWIEIHNLERYAVSLNGWTIEDSQAIAALPDFDIAAGATVLVVGSDAGIVVPAGETLIKLDIPRLGSGLRNAGDRVALINPYGVRHDAVSWGDQRWPRFIDAPNPGQSIIRTASGGQSLSDDPTPWTVDETISVDPKRDRHSRPDTMVRITSALASPLDNEPESFAVTNISDQPVLTVNWSLTVGRSLVKLRSVRIEPRASHTFTGADGKLGSGLNAAGGHLVLRDPMGNWLATASWGSDEKFHRLPSPAPGKEIRFSPQARIRPRVPWFESVDHGLQTMVHAGLPTQALLYADAAAVAVRDRQPNFTSQESEHPVIWISEVYPTAGQGRADPAFEWFELTNATDQEVNLDGWTIADNTSSDPLDGVIIPSGGSIVVGVMSQVGVAVIEAIADGRIGNGLANAGDQLRLIDPNARVVSAVSWGSDREYTTVKSPTSDESIHRSAPDAKPNIGAPSPGALVQTVVGGHENAAADAPASESPGADGEIEQTAAPIATASERPVLRITEILPAPLSGQPEWIEIHNPGDRPIDLEGWAIGDAAGQTELSGAIAAHSRLVIATGELPAGAPILLVDRIGNGLNNDGDTIYIYADDGWIVDQVQYGSEVLPSPERGRSLALEPQRWVVTAQPTPGEAGVTPLLDESFRTATPKEPVSTDRPLPIVEAAQHDDSDAWMIVSFALIGVIVTLVIRRWRPDEPTPDQAAAPTSYTGPSENPSPPDEVERSDERSGR